MNGSNEIVKKVSAYVATLIREKLPPWAVYHTIEHTQEVADAAVEIAQGNKLSKSEQEVVTLAAWFHDVGYIESSDGHEEKSAAMATEFLQGQGYPQDRIDLVAGCIRATRMPQDPQNLLEEIVCDADMVHLGKKKFFERSALLRFEWEVRRGKPFSDLEWLNLNIDFASKNNFHTQFARQEYSSRRNRNLLQLQDNLREFTARADAGNGKAKLRRDKEAAKAEKERRPERGIETMFRTVPKNHLDLSSMADQKANIMISTNAIIISIVFGLLVSKLDTHPHLVVPTIILLAVCLTAMVFAILATRPNVTSGTFTREDIEQKRANLLFFGNFHNSTLEDFEWGMKEMMNDKEYLYGAMVRDLYFLGRVLGKKYKLLRICYTVFMYGLILAVIAFGIALWNVPPPA